MAESKNELRQALNRVELVGALKEAKLEVKKNNDGKKYITGSLVLKCGEMSEVTLRVYRRKLTSKDNIDKAYETLEQILNDDSCTMAKVSEEEALKVRINGKDNFAPRIGENIYVKEGEDTVRTSINLELGFGNIKIDNDITPDDYKATFDVEMYVNKVKPEKDKNQEETGRAIVEGYVPVYGGLVVPLTVVAGVLPPLNEEDEEYDFGADILDEVEEGQTLEFWGSFNFQKIDEKVKKGGKLGRAKTEENVTYVHELVIEGADTVSESKEYEEEDIKKALVERENKINETLEKSKNENKDDKPKGRGLGGRTGARINKSDLSKTSNEAPADKKPSSRPRF